MTDIASALLAENYLLEVISSEKFTLTHEKYAMRYSSDELRPNGQDCMAQFREAVGKTKSRKQSGPALPSGGGMEM